MCRAFTKVNIKLFTDYLMKESWDEVYNAVDTNEKYNLFFSKLSIHLTRAFALKRGKLNFKPKVILGSPQELEHRVKTNVRFTYFQTS